MRNRLRCLNADPDAPPRRVLAELSLPGQEAHRSVPGDSGGGGHRPLEARGPLVAVHQVRRRQEPRAPPRAGRDEALARPPLFFNLKPGVAIGEATDFITKAAAQIVPPTVRAGLQGEDRKSVV